MIASSSTTAISERAIHSNSLLCNLSILRDKVQQIQSLVDVVVLPDQGRVDSVATAFSGMESLIQDIIVAASSMIYTCRKMSLEAMVHKGGKVSNDGHSQPRIEEFDHAISIGEGDDKGFFSGETSEVYHENLSYNGNGDDEAELHDGVQMSKGLCDFSSMNSDIIELDAANLLARYTHYCHICGKGFKRDANLRMHMRAHGDQYKSNAALSNPSRSSNSSLMGQKDYSSDSPRKYSCPQEGCRWNKKHPKFQPLKSMICVKNHYKRSHCPKMYVCNRCNQKQFSLLSDLRTHEKHCGDLKWQCSCGTTFSRKDKLMGHVALFIGHTPAMNCIVEPERFGC
ncbi:hypothetical protein MRB53_028260 [Persea americana]|uniref:Uncharacterized protein n=1 Tax=Persea americana TaxID=3435 RepID=A0ACC2KFD5_PERAE|nr:hypothetical protein MRB53_028260 [Persea americana]